MILQEAPHLREGKEDQKKDLPPSDRGVVTLPTGVVSQRHFLVENADKQVRSSPHTQSCFLASPPECTQKKAREKILQRSRQRLPSPSAKTNVSALTLSSQDGVRRIVSTVQPFSSRVLQTYFLSSDSQPKDKSENKRSGKVLPSLEEKPEYKAYLTPISDNARKRLISWGLTDNETHILQQVMGQFKDAYKRCVEKIRQFSTVYYHKINYPHTYYQVDFPMFFDGMGRKAGGQCLDLAYGCAYLLQAKGGLMDQLQQNPQTQNIALSIVTGSSETHFCNFDSTHLWSALTRSRPGCHPKVQDRNSMVVLDPSFQRIETIQESGYTIWDRSLSTPRQTTPKRTASLWTVQRARFEDVVAHPQDLFLPYRSKVFLGMSSDGVYALAVGFTNQDSVSSITPFVCAVCPDGTNKAYLYLDGKNGDVRHAATDDRIILTSDNINEARQILEHAKNLSFEYPDETAEAFLFAGK